MILVTGGAGFIGTSLVKRLLAEGKKVCVLDDYSTGTSGSDVLGTVPVMMDIREFIPDACLLDTTHIYHLACPASPIAYQRDPLKTVETCYQGTKNILDAARRIGAKVLFTSTSEVYGDPIIHPQPETYFGNVNTCGPRSVYDEGKRVAETLCYEYNRQYGMDIKVARLFNTYGPYMAPDDGRVISNFIMQRLMNKVVTIYGTGEQTRSFCYVDDMVEGLIRLMNSDFQGVMNLGNPEEISIKRLAMRIGVLLAHRPLPQDDPKQRCPDISLARGILDWEPKVDLEEGLRRTFDYFRAYTSGQDHTSLETESHSVG